MVVGCLRRVLLIKIFIGLSKGTHSEILEIWTSLKDLDMKRVLDSMYISEIVLTNEYK